MKTFYDSIQSLIALRAEPNLLVQKLNDVVMLNIRLILQSRATPECKISYGEDHIENIIWMLSLMTTSWILINLKSKVNDGHCYNIQHTHGADSPRLCSIGSQFHKEFFDDVLGSFNDILTLAKSNSPEVIA